MNQVLQILTALVIHLLMISTLVFFSNHIQSGIQNRIQNPHSLHLDPQPQLVHLFDYHRVSACEILHREYLIGVRFPKNQDFSPKKWKELKLTILKYFVILLIGRLSMLCFLTIVLTIFHIRITRFFTVATSYSGHQITLWSYFGP